MRAKGTVPILLGVLLMVGAAVLTGFNFWQNRQAGETAARDLEVLVQAQALSTAPKIELPVQSVPVEEYLPEPEMEMPVIEVDGREYVGIVDLPSIYRMLPVLSSWDAEQLQIAPCRYRGSVYTDNLILVAHNYDSHFGNLKKLEIGDPVVFRDVEGNRFSYEVISLETLNPGDTQKMVEGDWDLTLFTCTVGGKARVTVRCALVEAIMNTEEVEGIG